MSDEGAISTIALLLGSALATPPRLLRFEHINAEKGLSHDTVYGVAQDQRGFMWFGTPEGLNRYDGRYFKAYTQDPERENSLSNNSISTLLAGRDGYLWIGTWGGGLNRLDPEMETFTRYGGVGKRVQTLFEDKKGQIWVGTFQSGLLRLDPISGTMRRYRHLPDDPNSLSHDRIWSINQSEDGLIWVGTEKGFNRLDPDTEQFVRYLKGSDRGNGLIHDKTRVVFINQAGEIWIGTEEGLARFDRDNEVFDAWKLPGDAQKRFHNNRIQTIVEEKPGIFWGWHYRWVESGRYNHA